MSVFYPAYFYVVMYHAGGRKQRLPFNIFSTYYFQAIMKPLAAFVVSVARGCVISGILIMVLPMSGNPDSLWLAMPITELVVMIYAMVTIGKYTRTLPQKV